ncbi:hypothetical protein AVEN_107548-1 [Araneus ventricosus]|uniref:Uncharacterized protein n=1 Tax=Araneus ventricosus TaxID=182803 RepID=A0A4Y2EAQ6_ARAVE|nr:hypothetical protein AVEN_107548-1 [Araneus ventricosus]
MMLIPDFLNTEARSLFVRVPYTDGFEEQCKFLKPRVHGSSTPRKFSLYQSLRFSRGTTHHKSPTHTSKAFMARQSKWSDGCWSRLTLSYRASSPGQFKNFPLTSTRAGLRRLASNEGR